VLDERLLVEGFVGRGLLTPDVVLKSKQPG
jgi:hypothetical protein